MIDDDVLADLIEQLALAVADRDEELRSVRSLLSVALSHLHAEHVGAARLRERLIETRRRERAT